MSCETTYRLRGRPGAESFAAAWDFALAAAPRRGPSISVLLWHRAFYGVARPIVRGGREVGTVVKADKRPLSPAAAPRPTRGNGRERRGGRSR